MSTSVQSLQQLLPIAISQIHNGRMDRRTDRGDLSRWRRLGELATIRRVQLGYKRRPAFAQASGISIRILGDLETGRRSNYERTTLAALENALQWTNGSVRQVLAGGEPTSIALPVVDGRPGVMAQPDEALIRVMSRRDLTSDQQRRIVRLLIAEREAADRLRVEHAEEMIRLLLDTR